MRLAVSITVLALLALIGQPGSAWAERRVALVIGNSAYEQVPALANPRNDAIAISQALKRLDFEVVEGIDLTNRAFLSKVREFTKAIRGADVALLFYAGHGLQVEGRNYLAPIDTQLLDESDLDFETIPLGVIMRQMEREQRVNLVFLDACRDNPLSRNLAMSMGTRSTNVGRGLAVVESGVGTLISYATQPGNVALDGDGENSPFTSSLLKHIETPGEDIAVILRKVRGEVIEQTAGKQVPWGNSSLTGRVVLKPAVATPAPEPEADRQLDAIFWDSIKDEKRKVYFKTYLDQFPDGKFAPIARLKMREIDAANLERRQAEEARRRAADAADAAERRRRSEIEAERRRKAEAQRLRLEKEAESARLAASKRQAELERLRKKQQDEEAARAKMLAEVEQTRKSYEARLAKLEAQRKQMSDQLKSKKRPAPSGEIKTALLVPDAEPIKKPAESAIDYKKDRDFVRSLQTELNRVGCSAGTADGIWGRNTQRAMSSYAKNGKVKLASLEPSPDFLESLKKQKQRICPLVCGNGYKVKNGRCERVKSTSPTKTKTKTNTDSKKSQPTVKKKQKTKKVASNCPSNARGAAFSIWPRGSGVGRSGVKRISGRHRCGRRIVCSRSSSSSKFWKCAWQ
ncbi:MAG: caspase family protein [Rhizobiaceae bacterium]